MELVEILVFSVPFLLLSYKLWRFLDCRRNRQPYILDYECYMPKDDRKLNTKLSGEIVLRNKNLGLHEHQFLLKAIVNSGIGEETYGPKIVFDGREASPVLDDARLEMDDFLHDSIGKLFARTGISPSEIDVLVVNVSMLATVPSLASRIINIYKMRDDVKAYNVTGMGCSASLISINIVQNVCASRGNVHALVVTSESLSLNWYSGNDKSMILANSLFRTGGCAMILTNKPSLRRNAMFKLKILVRTHHGARDDAYNCCQQKEDDKGLLGFFLGKNLPKAATQAFIENLNEIAPRILPIRELLRFTIVSYFRKLCRRQSKAGAGAGAGRAGINFKTGVDHFCLHTGGKAVIDAIKQSLSLTEQEVEPARMTLHRFGNTSASSLWYVLAYMEAKRRLKKGERIFMISFGAGFKCNSCVWEVTRELEGENNVWKEFVHRYPLNLKELANPFLSRYGWLREKDPATFSLPHDYVVPD
ncbi:3-ketoacyl-CoA synthase 12-like [Andrographis paniculata]|uniref:3-ketoacyl-CoA synthase 12-like n=1 Tax=Andrographis paniculata TaxID=175694 RepID=UPI0021E7E468|nr:3-ketoacyl-CoA synthase 12-like [Andrographis paniculata]